MKHLCALLIVCAGLGWYPQQSHAGSCADQIAQLEMALNRSAADGKAALTAPESLNAKLHHQPTPTSISRAEEKARSRVDELLAEAKDLDAKGESSECLQIVGDVRSIVDLQ